MAIGDEVSTSNKMEEYENLAKLISKGEQIPENLLSLLLDVYQSSVGMQKEEDGVLIPKEYELVYAGKGRKEEILSTTKAAPLQKVRTFNSGNKFEDDWENKLILGDNLKVLKSLADNSEIKGKVKLIYIDPPFATKKDFMKNAEKAYSDKVTGSAFIEFIRKRLILMNELLADDGQIYVHLDSKKGHYIKTILDEIFGEHNFRNEIIWCQKMTSLVNTTLFLDIANQIVITLKSQCGSIHKLDREGEVVEKFTTLMLSLLRMIGG